MIRSIEVVDQINTARVRYCVRYFHTLGEHVSLLRNVLSVIGCYVPFSGAKRERLECMLSPTTLESSRVQSSVKYSSYEFSSRWLSPQDGEDSRDSVK